DRLRIVQRHAFSHRLQHHGLAGLGRRDDERALPEADRTDQVHHALDVRGTRTRGAGRFERQRPRRVDRAELRELGAVAERRAGRRAVDAQHATVLEREQIAPAQTGKAHGDVALRGEIAIRREPQEAAFGGGVEPAGNGRQGLKGNYRRLTAIFPSTCAKTTSATSASWPTSTTASRRWPTG